MLSVLLMLSPVVEAPQTAGLDQPDLIVEARSDDRQKRLADCIARKCPPNEDADAALALASQQFIEGDYRAARETINRSLARTRSQTRAYPIPVSKLWQGLSLVDTHLGNFTFAQSESVRAYYVLQSNLPTDDPRTLNAGLELAAVYGHQNNWDAARNLYTSLIERSEQAPHPDIAARARIKFAKFIAFTAPGKIGKDEQRQIRNILAPLIGSSNADYRVFDFPARLFLAKIAEEMGETGAVAALYATLPSDQRLPPILISSTPIRANKMIESPRERAIQCLENPSVISCQRAEDLIATQNLDRQWIDVAFSIRPDGSVSDVDVIRQSPVYAGDWSTRVVASVQSRRYARTANATESGGIQRLERYTLTSQTRVFSGSRLPRKEADEVFEMVDLTRQPINRGR
ncbi:MAG: hypothetical protein K2X59_05810 [Sphingomonas sp.]|nr:hypothetical protein [Sphingomonas sp.]